MALPVVESYTYTNNGSNSVATVNMPATRPDGDLYLVMVFVDSDYVTAATGWTELQAGVTNAECNGWMGYRIGSSEPASYSFTLSSSDESSVHLWRISGFDATTPINDSAYFNNLRSNAVCLTLTTTANDCLILQGIGIDDDPLTETPANFTVLDKNTDQGTIGTGAGRYEAGAPGVKTGSTIGTWVWAYDQFSQLAVAIAPLQGFPGVAKYNQTTAVNIANYNGTSKASFADLNEIIE